MSRIDVWYVNGVLAGREVGDQLDTLAAGNIDRGADALNDLEQSVEMELRRRGVKARTQIKTRNMRTGRVETQPGWVLADSTWKARPEDLSGSVAVVGKIADRIEKELKCLPHPV